MIKLEAAQRLKVMAAVNEEQARKYLKSLGVNPGRKLTKTDVQNFIDFEIEDAEAAAAALGKHLKGTSSKGPRTGTKQWVFPVADGHRIRISDKRGRQPARITVIDTSRFFNDPSKAH